MAGDQDRQDRALADVASGARLALLALGFEPNPMTGQPAARQACAWLGTLRTVVAVAIDRLGPAAAPLIDQAAETAMDDITRAEGH